MSPWIEAMRLRTLPVSVAGVITASALAIAHGTYNIVPLVLCLIFAVLCQIASNFANEYYDYRANRDRAGREGPRRGVTEGDITPQAMKRATFGTLAVASFIGLWLTYWGGVWLIWIGIGIALGALAYSAGPWPLSTHCLGEIAVIFFFGIIPVNFTYYVSTGEWSSETLKASVAIGLFGANVLIINNYRDQIEDLAVGKHTLANTHPSWAMPWLYAINVTIAVVFTHNFWHGLWDTVPCVFLALAYLTAYDMPKLKGRELTPLLGKTSIIMLAYALFFFIEICVSL